MPERDLPGRQAGEAEEAGSLACLPACLAASWHPARLDMQFAIAIAALFSRIILLHISFRGCCCVSSSVGVIARLQKISSWSNAKYAKYTTKYKNTKLAAEVEDEKETELRERKRGLHRHVPSILQAMDAVAVPEARTLSFIYEILSLAAAAATRRSPSYTCHTCNRGTTT